MEIKEDENLLVVRYSNLYDIDCIKEHLNVLKSKGFVYFGKCGSKPSQKVYKQIMESDNPRIILISKDTAFVCDIDEIIFEKPSEGYPKYYDETLINKGARFSAFFKIKSMYNLGRKNIGIFYVASSLSSLSDALHHSMTSMMLVKANKNYTLEEVK